MSIDPTLLVLIPLAAGVAAFVAGGVARWIGLAAALAVSVLTAALCLEIAAGGARRYLVGGWGAPLGIDLKIDGLAALMLAMTAIVGLAVSTQAQRSMRPEPAAANAAADPRWAFWPLWLVLWSGLNALFLTGDVFNIYVTLEIVSLAAAGLTALSGKAEALRAALRYLLASLFASLLYLFGVGLLYAAYGTLDLEGLRAMLRPEPVAWVAMALMLSGLALKTALFPLHVWLPPAHGNAAGTASALLSALVVKASFYLILRLWFDLFAPSDIASQAAALLLGMLGAGAILWGSLQALRAERLKLLVAYSTVAQIGYLFLVFPLDGSTRGVAWHGVVYLALSHAVAKAAMFLACETVQERLGHDRIAELDGLRTVPIGIRVAMALSAVSLIGLPPSGGFIGKWLLTSTAFSRGQGLWVAVIAVGTLLSAAAMFRVLARFFVASSAQMPHGTTAGGSDILGGVIPLILACAAIVLGFTATDLLRLLAVGTAP